MNWKPSHFPYIYSYKTEMTLVQLEYIIAVDTYKSFVMAAEKCFVTQPTLSMQIQKLEASLGVRIFDRSKQPILPTDIGKTIINQARIVLKESDKIKELIIETKDELGGEIRIGIIPTLAPYLLPLFIQKFNKRFPEVKLVVQEALTTQIVQLLREGLLDTGIVVTPLNEKGIHEQVLFYEELLVYASKNNNNFNNSILFLEFIGKIHVKT